MSQNFQDDFMYEFSVQLGKILLDHYMANEERSYTFVPEFNDILFPQKEIELSNRAFTIKNGLKVNFILTEEQENFSLNGYFYWLTDGVLYKDEVNYAQPTIDIEINRVKDFNAREQVTLLENFIYTIRHELQHSQQDYAKEVALRDEKGNFVPQVQEDVDDSNYEEFNLKEQVDYLFKDYEIDATVAGLKTLQRYTDADFDYLVDDLIDNVRDCWLKIDQDSKENIEKYAK